MQNLTKADFLPKVLEATKPVFLYFSAPWCIPCRTSAPILERIEAQYPGVEFFKVNVDEEGTLAEDCSVRSLPTFMVFKNGENTGTLVGMAPEAKLQGLLRD